MLKIAVKKSDRVVYIIAAIAIAVIILAAVYSLFYYPKCNNLSCFKGELGKCSKASFLNEKETAVWYYGIKGLSNGECIVYVKAVSLKAEAETGEALSGKDMTCFIPKSLLGAFMPEEKIEYCHGILKEEIQKLMIEKMHLYIVQNIGQINQTELRAI